MYIQYIVEIYIKYYRSGFRKRGCVETKWDTAQFVGHSNTCMVRGAIYDVQKDIFYASGEYNFPARKSTEKEKLRKRYFNRHWPTRV